MLKPDCFFSVVASFDAVWMESNHSHLRLDLIAIDLSVDLLAEDLLKGFIDHQSLHHFRLNMCPGPVSPLTFE